MNLEKPVLPAIGNGGFLPAADPLAKVNRRECAGLNWVTERLTYFFSNYGIAAVPQIIDSLSNFTFFSLDLNQLNPEEKIALRRDLAFIAHAYYHTLKQDGQPLVLPAIIARPLWQLSLEAQTQPVMSYHLYALNNLRRCNSQKPLSLENLRIIRRFVSDIDEERFIIVHIAIEAIAAPIFSRLIPECFPAISDHQWKDVEVNLNIIGNLIHEMIRCFRLMPDGCHEDAYHKVVRPQIQPLREIIFEGVAELRGSPQSFIAGETGAQSAIAPALDGFLGIQHAPNDGIDYLQIMRQHMLPEHRAYIEALEKTKPTLRALLIELKNPYLIKSFNYAVNAFYQFRLCHLDFATHYVFTKPTPQQGTGGAPAAQWLRQLAIETQQALIK